MEVSLSFHFTISVLRVLNVWIYAGLSAFRIIVPIARQNSVCNRWWSMNNICSLFAIFPELSSSVWTMIDLTFLIVFSWHWRIRTRTGILPHYSNIDLIDNVGSLSALFLDLTIFLWVDSCAGLWTVPSWRLYRASTSWWEEVLQGWVFRSAFLRL